MVKNVKVKVPFLGFVFWVLCFAALALPKPANADPHGVFFTVVGQQQLFFNVLAALNQADYVESLELRQQLAQQRNEAGFAPSAAQALTDSETELAALLTREVSLEGQDVRTQERADEYAREVVRQRETAQIIQDICEDAFGVRDCLAEDEAAQRQFVEETELAFVKDPIKHALLPHELGVKGVLQSGTPERAQQAIDMLNSREQLPLAYSETVARLRQEAQAAGVGDQFERTVKRVEESFLPSRIRPEVLQLVTINQNGQIDFDEDANSSPIYQGSPVSARDYLAVWRGLLSLDDVLYDQAQAGRWRVERQVFDTVVNNTIPDRVQKFDVTDNFQTGEISTLVTAPVTSKIGEQENAPLLPFFVANNPQFADPSLINNPDGGEVAAPDHVGDLNIGTPLQPFRETDVVDKGVWQISGVEDRRGLNRSLFQERVEQILNGANQQ